MQPLEDELEVAHEINVTPFIDVTLVLLIIFMVAAPLATVNVPVNLPAAVSTEKQPPKEPIYLTLQRDHQLLLGEDQVAKKQLITQLQQLTQGDHKRRIYIRADKGLPYGDVMALLSRLQKAEFTHVALVGMDKG